MRKKNYIEANEVTPIKNRVFVTDLDHGAKISKGGIIITDDNATERGIRNRWARVYKVGPEIDDLKPGDWVLLQHGRWTEAIDLKLPDGDVQIWYIDYPEAVILVCDEDPRESSDFHF